MMNKRIISLLTCLVMILSLLPAAPALAASPEGDWVELPGVVGGQLCFDAATGTITAADTTITQANIPAAINGTPVTTIGVRTFAFAAYLTSVTMPNSVTSIGQEAFHGCAALRSITFSTALQSIGPAAFNECKALSSVSLPATLRQLGDPAARDPDNLFMECSALTAINVAASNPNFTSIDGVLFNKNCTRLIAYPRARAGAYVVPGSVRFIGANAFSNCSALTGITIPDGVTDIEGNAFAKCAALTHVTLPATAQNIDSQSFYKCGALEAIDVAASNPNYTSQNGVLFNKDHTTLLQYPGGRAGAYTIPASVTTVAASAFSGCTHLASVTVPASVATIGSGAFEYCPNLTDIHVDAANAIYKSVDGVVFNKAGTELLLCPSGRAGTYAIPNGVTGIGDMAFWTCAKLTGITIPEGVTSIGMIAFARCTRLASLTIPSSMDTIDLYAFTNCDSLARIDVREQNNTFTSSDGVLFNDTCTTLISFPAGRQGVYTVPDGVTHIGESAFLSCERIAGVKLPASVSILSDGAFSDCYSLKSVGFAGAAPTLEYDPGGSPYSNVFRLRHSAFMLYYLEGQAGWTTPHWKGYKTALWDGENLPIPPDPPEATGAAGTPGQGVVDHGIAYRFKGELLWLPDGSLKCIVDAERSKYVSTSIDNVPLEAKDVTVIEGSTVVTVSGARIAQLKDGAHTLRVQFTDGRAETAFTTPHSGAVLTAGIPAVPATGGAPLWALPLALLTLAGAACRRRRAKDEIGA